MAALFTVKMDLIEGMEAYLAKQKAERGRSEMHTLQRMMKYWVSYAMAKVKRADKQEIRIYLMGKMKGASSSWPKTGRRAAKRKEELRNTRAIATVVKINYKGLGRAARGDDLYKLAAKYVNARVYAAGHHRAGFIPALTVLKEPQGEKLPVYRRGLAGRIDFSTKDDEMTIIVENWAKVIAELAPNAFEQATAELEATLAKFLQADQISAMKAAGLQIT